MISERGTCPTPQTGTMEWYLDGHVYRNHFYAIWAWTHGLIGITLNEKAVHKWAMSLHICSRLMKDVADLKDSSPVEITSHKEELASRVKYDENDRQVIREKLQTCIDPLNTASHLLNIVTGHICTDEVNVHNAIDLGKSQMKEYEASWPAAQEESSYNEREQEKQQQQLLLSSLTLD